jgi:hypothetical protein
MRTFDCDGIPVESVKTTRALPWPSAVAATEAGFALLAILLWSILLSPSLPFWMWVIAFCLWNVLVLGTVGFVRRLCPWTLRVKLFRLKKRRVFRGTATLTNVVMAVLDGIPTNVKAANVWWFLQDAPAAAVERQALTVPPELKGTIEIKRDPNGFILSLTTPANRQWETFVGFTPHPSSRAKMAFK